MATERQPARPREPRRELILTEAARLFRERGFHGVGIDDIGAAAGITGPGVYRHFRSKDAVLGALMERAVAQLLERAEQIVDEGLPPHETLERLVGAHVDSVLENPDLTAVYFLEARHLTAERRHRRRRRERLYMEHWSATLADLGGGLSEGYVRVAVQSALWLINAFSLQREGLDSEKVRAMLTRMAVSALLSAVPAPALSPSVPSGSR
jgi:AcrR family transcriptional regulator